MALDDYTRSHAPEKKAPRKNKSKKNAPQNSAGTIFIILLSALVGFFGGIFAIRVSPSLVTSNSNITQRIVVEEGELIADIVERVSASVVSIDVTSVEDVFNPFFGSSSFESQGAGTGIILTSDGLVVTNDHVIPENTTEVSVVMSDGTTYENVAVIGREPFNDIAYLQIEDARDLQPAMLGDSDRVRVGEQVIAIGNALGEFDATVTSGIISGEGRPIVAGTGSDSELLVNLFQTDASINPGNSGGPLLNMSGEVIGINTAVAGNAENIGFAIPINDVTPGITSIEQNGELIRPYLGVRYITLDKEIAEELEVDSEVGALIYDERDDRAIIDDSPADKAGLQNGDIILEVNGDELSEDHPLPNAVSRYQVGEEITLKILRDGEEQDVQVTFEQVPDSL